jgi:hypothetical protein
LIAGARSDAVAALAQDAGQRGFAHFDRLSAKVGTVQLQQVERIEDRIGPVLPAAERLEDS